MKLSFALAAIAVGTIGLAGAAEAASLGATQDITFDFRGYGGFAPSFSFEDSASGLSVSATAGPSRSKVSQNIWGLGVRNFQHGGDSQPTQVDSFGTNESFFLTFSHDVSVSEIYFGEVDGNDDATIKLDGTTIFGNANIAHSIDAGDGLNTTLVGNVLEFRVGDRRVCSYSRCFTVEDRDDFTIKGVRVTKAVPEPLTVIGSIVALGLGGTLRRKFAR